jgi:integrase
MGHSDLDPAVHERRPWNAGKNVGPKCPLKPRDIWAIRFYLDEHKRLRDRALFDLTIDSKLRGCDLVKLRIGDVVSAGQIRNRATVIQQKTGRPVQFEIMMEARRSLETWLQRRGGTVLDFVFPSRIDYMGHLSTRQYARLVDEWVTTIGLDSREYGTHSMRRTKASLIYKATGNLRAVQILLGHTNIENTVRYLGVDVDDALTLSERTDILSNAGLWPGWGRLFALDAQSPDDLPVVPTDSNGSSSDSHDQELFNQAPGSSVVCQILTRL